VTVRHIATDVSAHSDSGSLTIQDVGGTLETGTDSGSTHATELRSPTVKASADSGSVRLDFTAVPTTVRANSDSGSLNLTLPSGTYDVAARTDSGGKHITVPTASAAQSKIYVSTDSGGVNVVPAA
jgi:DUF4097 and DUF4098 domain-containing protein YvlB